MKPKLKHKKQKKDGVNKTANIQPLQKTSIMMIKKEKKRILALLPLPAVPAVCKNQITTITAKDSIKNPLKTMLKQCNFQASHSNGLNLLIKNDFKPKINKEQCSIDVVDYTVPMPPVDDFDIEISEYDTSDLGSPVETSEDDTPTEPVFIEKKVGEWRRYHVPSGAVILLYKNSTLFMHGFMRLSVLHGTVDIHGKHIDMMSAPCMVYSPKGTGFLSMKNVNAPAKTEESRRKSLKRRITSLGIDADVAQDIVTFKVKVTTVVLHCENVMDKATEFLELNLAQKIYPKVQNGLRCTFKNVTSKDWNVLDVNPDWSLITSEVSERSSYSGKKIILCGGKGVGKSTLLRFVVNNLLNTRPAVFVLDLDPGQPEFTMPGAISLVRVSSALLGPNYTHLQDTIKTVFVPNINITADHEGYLEAVRILLISLECVPPNVPVVVNYMGFTKGIGVWLTAMVLRLLAADVVVQIESDNPSKNFNMNLNADTIKRVLNDDVKMSSFKLIKIDSCARNLEHVGWELEPRQVREMCILAYMSRALSGSCTFLTEKSVPVYQTCLDDIKVMFNGRECDPAVANANIVALCTEDGSTCLGWGIVRGICQQSNSMFMITPLDGEQMQSVANVVVGSVTMPPAIYLRHHDAIHGLIPYTFKGELSNFARTPKRNMLPKQYRK